ncbi:MerR family transcriptional regulator [Flindersiella endophytica]
MDEFDDPDERRWTIGELAKASGTTVRTLHHYDEIGLLRPTERTAAGHRRYTEADVRRLYRVRALAGLGLSLDEVAVALTQAATDIEGLRDLLTAQLAALDARAAQLEDLRGRVQVLLNQLNDDTLPGADSFLSTLEPLRTLDIDAYLTHREQAALARRAGELGAENVDDLKSEWLRLVAELRRHHREQTPVDDARVQALAARWYEIGAAFRTGDQSVDEQIDIAAEKVWQDGGAAISEELEPRIGWPGGGAGLAEVVEYVRSAREARR